MLAVGVGLVESNRDAPSASSVVRVVTLRARPFAAALDAGAGRVLVVNLSAADNSVSLFIADESAAGTLHVLDSGTGRALRAVPVGPYPIGVAVDERTGRVVIAALGAMDAAGNATGPGRVSILAAADGRVLRAAPVGLGAEIVVVNERTGRAFVLSAGGPVPVPSP